MSSGVDNEKSAIRFTMFWKLLFGNWIDWKKIVGGGLV
jgi:hypothetical protein